LGLEKNVRLEAPPPERPPGDDLAPEDLSSIHHKFIPHRADETAVFW
jgi:hypothetical protein